MRRTRSILWLLLCLVPGLGAVGCTSTLRPLDAEVVASDPALLDATRSVALMASIPELSVRNARGSRRFSIKLSSLVYVGDGLALTAAHSVVGRAMDNPDADDRSTRVLVGWRTMPARVIGRGDAEAPADDWAVVRLGGLREGGDVRDDGVPVTTLATPVVGERCVLIGYPQRYLERGWHRGAPWLRRRTPDDSPWRPPMPLVFEGRITGVDTADGGHRVAINADGTGLGGLSGGGAFVLRDGRWALIGPIAHDQIWWWKREIGVTALPQDLAGLVPSLAPMHADAE